MDATDAGSASDDGTVMVDALDSATSDASTADASETAIADATEAATTDVSDSAPGDVASDDVTDAGTSDDVPDASTSDGGDAMDESDDAAVSCNLDGNWLATMVSCNGTPVQLSPLVWTGTIAGTQGSFSETINGCTLTEAGPISCVGNVLNVYQMNPTTCQPAACSPFTSSCDVNPNDTASWTLQRNADGSYTLTSIDPTPYTTCTSLGMSNPIQVTWVPN